MFTVYKLDGRKFANYRPSATYNILKVGELSRGTTYNTTAYPILERAYIVRRGKSIQCKSLVPLRAVCCFTGGRKTTKVYGNAGMRPTLQGVHSQLRSLLLMLK